ncbi:hypothetical protein [Shimwellia pseudoproteus]|nr:hypothetical protein [Shimwellia pseudoproteus]
MHIPYSAALLLLVSVAFWLGFAVILIVLFIIGAVIQFVSLKAVARE